MGNYGHAACETSGANKVIKVSDKVMAVFLVFEEDVLRLIHGYALQSGRSLKEKHSIIR